MVRTSAMPPVTRAAAAAAADHRRTRPRGARCFDIEPPWGEQRVTLEISCCSRFIQVGPVSVDLESESICMPLRAACTALAAIFR